MASEGIGGRVAIARQGYVFGVRETIQNLRAIGITLSQSAVRRGLYAGAVVIRDEARARAPKRTGALSKAIVAETRGVGRDSRGRPSKHVAVVTIAKKAYTVGKGGRARVAKREPGQTMPYRRGQIYPRNYAHLVEYGSGAHAIRARRAKRLATPYGAFLEVWHPGARPRPFMRPAFDAKVREAEAAFARVIGDEVKKAVARAQARRIGGFGSGRRVA